jgi:hypothetical protein
MSDTFEKVKLLVAEGDFLISAHGYDELAADDIFLSDVLDSIEGGVVVEDYPSFAKGPCVLVLQRSGQNALHVVWGIAAGLERPAVLITAYRPDPARWSGDFMQRKSR